MTAIENLDSRFREAGALVVSRHDFKRDGLVLSATIPAGILTKLARGLKDDGYALLDLSVLEAKEGFLVTYHFDSFREPGRLALRVLATEEMPEVPSLYGIFEGAEWHERESADFYGLIFFGNPNPVPLILPADFDGPPPLRKDPKDLAALSALGLFGQADVLDPSWEALVNPPAPDKPGAGDGAGA
ncbi:MAG: NADH-quinone oxidoreductase subunit C [Deltaproteobacteria bacterium]|jgi:NADH-quinone oxidoreductase subunit C|nr:NADH-quinone oxidoreductase subunit C [Deltaproteobacteria bacterium]